MSSIEIDLWLQDAIEERLTGHVYGEVDPQLPLNAIITDLAFAPRNERGMVEYVSTFTIVKPADMANAIVDLLDRVKSRIQRERAAVGLKLVRNEYQKVRQELRDMEDEIKALRRKGVHEYEGQSMVVSEQYATAIAEGRSEKTIKQLKSVLDTLAKYGGRYVALRDELHLMKEEEVKIKTKLDQSRVDAEQVLPATFRVNAAISADKKKYPVRWLVVVVSAISAFVATMVVILGANTWKELKDKLPS